MGGRCPRRATWRAAAAALALAAAATARAELPPPPARPAPPPAAPAVARASSARPGAGAALAADADPATAWRSADPGEAWLALDLGAAQLLGAVAIDWADGRFATDYTIELSHDGARFEAAARVTGGNGGRDLVYLGRRAARFVRLALARSGGDGFAVARLEAVPAATIASPNDFLAAVAASAPRGAWPRYWLREQSYWTAVGVPGEVPKALVSEDGAIEPAMRSFSIEPFLEIGGRLVTWADVEAEASLEEGALPIPHVVWRHPSGVAVAETVFAASGPGVPVLYAVYRVENPGDARRRVALHLALRPFQVNPPWQDLNGAGGVSPIHRVARDGRVVWVNGAVALVALTEPDAFGAAPFERGPIVEWLASGALPPAASASDPLGLASAALRFDLDLAPGARRAVLVAVPLRAPRAALRQLPPARDAAAFVAARLEETARAWRERVVGPTLRLPPAAEPIAPALHAAVGQILVARTGPALQPGTRTYARAWIRDGVLMSTALLQMGRSQEALAFVRWFAEHQNADGTVPCCIDWRGSDPAVEHDSHGELIHGIVEWYRFARDTAGLRALWPHVLRAGEAIDALRQQRRTPAYRTPENRHFFGLLPESISHEGYARRPVHSYWDDFWALRGLEDAVFAARALGEDGAVGRLAGIRDSFRADLRDSIAATMRVHGMATLPASADLGDFDPTATSIALAPGGARELLPEAALEHTFDVYLDDFRRRRSGDRDWDAYTPYELRNVEALVRLGRRDDALFVLREILGDQRPPGWRGWAEMVWRDPRAPRFIGDMPHAWIAASYVRAVRSLFVYECEEEASLVVAAGVPLAWIEGEGVAVAGLPTHHGRLSYRIEPAGEGRTTVTIDAGPVVPPGGIVVRAPAPLRGAQLDGRPAPEWTRDAVTLRALPARALLEY